MRNQVYIISQSDVNDIDYLIITSEDYEDTLQPLIDWKMQRGLSATIETIESISVNYEGVDTSEKIRSCIIDYYERRETAWILLAGGSAIVPTRSVRIGDTIVSSESYYSNLDDNWELGSMYATLNDPDDWEPEVFVGRLPADSESEMVSLVSRLIQYERNPPIGDWMKHAVYAGTFCNFDYDANGNNVLDDGDFPAFDTNSNHNWLSDNLLPDDWTSTHLAETEGLRVTEYPYDVPLNETNFVTSINNGSCIVMADAHGSPTGMFRTIFTNDVDGDSLFDPGVDGQNGIPFLSSSTQFDVDGKLGFYFLAACSTGTFTEGTCLTEYITRTSGIGCIGSSKSAGYDPLMYNYGGDEHLGWMTQGLSERVWEQILVLGNNHPGMALAMAKHNYSLDRVQYEGDDDNGRTMAQFNLMGDPEVPLWIGVPSTFEMPSIEVDEEYREIVISASEVSPLLSDTMITLHSPTFYQREITSSGVVTLNMPNLSEAENLTITLSKDGYVPLQIVIELPAGSLYVDPLPLVSSFAIVALVAGVLFWYKLKR